MSGNDIDDVVKRAHANDTYTLHTLQELEKCMEDPLYFIEKYVMIQHPTKGCVNFEPYEYQRRLISGFHSSNYLVAMCGRQMGKALALDTPIPTPTGWTTMGEIKVGDMILGADGKPTTVTFATDIMTNHSCYEVSFDNGETIVADAEHLWEVSVPKRNGKMVLTTEELIPHLARSRKFGRGLYITAAKPLDLPDCDLPIAPYTLGVWLGDGNSADARVHIWNKESSELRSHIENDGFALSEQIQDKRGNVVRQTIYGLRGKLASLGLLNNKHIPAQYLRASTKQRLELLRGLMDTDGHASPNGGCEFYQKKLSFIEDVRELLSSLGIKSRLTTKIINGENYYKLRFATVDFEVFKLSRKKTIQQATIGHQKNKRVYIHDIRKTSSVPVRCIQVDNEDHLFLCGKTMIPTHNTTCAAAYLLWRAMFTPDFTILIAANKFVQAMEIMDRIRYSYENLPNWIRAGVVEYNKGTMKFDNGSKIVSRATSPDAGRGLSISLLYLDEFAFVRPTIATEFWTAMQPTLATGGGCIITSTPNNDEDQFAQIWFGALNQYDEDGNEIPGGVGRNGFKPILVKWDEHPERDEEWEKKFRAALGDGKFDREFNCLGGDSTIELCDSQCEKRQISLGDLYNELKPGDK